jgi:hypothetical protein
MSRNEAEEVVSVVASISSSLGGILLESSEESGLHQMATS